jgi:hypothetical protein
MDRLILNDRINWEDKTLAEITAEKVCHELGMRQVPKIKFFHSSILGYYRLGVVYLNCHLSREELLCTTRHECRHYWQDRQPRFRGLGHELCERDARIYEVSDF